MKQQDQINFSSNRFSMKKFKIVLIGDQNVGKSSNILRYIKNDFDNTCNPTIGIDFTSKTVSIGGKTIKLQLWDTAGQQRFRSIIPSYLKDCDLAIIVYDITAETTSESIMKWIDFVKESKGPDANIFIVGNKIDLQSMKRADSIERVKEIAFQQKIPYKEVSAKASLRIQQLFQQVATKLFKLSTQTSNSQTKPGSPVKLQSSSKKLPSYTRLCC